MIIIPFSPSFLNNVTKKRAQTCVRSLTQALSGHQTSKFNPEYTGEYNSDEFNLWIIDSYNMAWKFYSMLAVFNS